jgi:hypothetical protein
MFCFSMLLLCLGLSLSILIPHLSELQLGGFARLTTPFLTFAGLFLFFFASGCHDHVPHTLQRQAIQSTEALWRSRGTFSQAAFYSTPNDAPNRTEPFRSVTETETVGSVGKPGCRVQVTVFATVMHFNKQMQHRICGRHSGHHRESTATRERWAQRVA